MDLWQNVAPTIDFSLAIDLPRFSQGLADSARILDMGCGYGRITEQLQRAGYRNLYGVDASAAMISRGREEFPQLQLLHSDDPLAQFPADHFDAILACAVLTCIPCQQERSTLIRQLWQWLKPGGCLYLAEFCHADGVRFMSGFGIDMWHSRPAELRALLTGFSIEEDEIRTEKTLSGQTALSCHLFARKQASFYP